MTRPSVTSSELLEGLGLHATRCPRCVAWRKRSDGDLTVRTPKRRCQRYRRLARVLAQTYGEERGRRRRRRAALKAAFVIGVVVLVLLGVLA